MKKIDALLLEYGESHQDSTNKTIHWICVPLIFLSVVGLIASIPAEPLQRITEGNPYANWATVLMILVIVYYVSLSIPLAIGMTLFGLLCLFICNVIVQLNIAPLWLVCVVIFVLAWIGQFYGHKVEGEKAFVPEGHSISDDWSSVADAFYLQESRNPVLIVPFSFHEGIPERSALTIDPGIFHDPNHLTLQAPSGWYSFYIQHNEKVEGVVQFHLEKGEAASPYRSSFGSYLFSDVITEAVLTGFVTYCENQLTDKSAISIILKNQPEVYSEKNLLLLNVLNSLGYSILKEETSAVIPVSSKPFESGLHKSEKKKLRKCRDSALTFEIIPLEQLQKIYIFLEACREEKGYSLSMSFEEMKQLAKAFPERIILTAVIDRSQIVAANISIRVYNHVLYNFYHDHASEYDLVSPVVLLNEGLYLLCQKENIQLLDLGTSNINDELNESLLNFKLNLGAKTSRKLTFTKNLA